MTQETYATLRGLLILFLIFIPVLLLVMYAICARSGEISREEDEQAETVRRWREMDGVQDD
jgi:hypothetical protein